MKAITQSQQIRLLNRSTAKPESFQWIWSLVIYSRASHALYIMILGSFLAALQRCNVHKLLIYILLFTLLNT